MFTKQLLNFIFSWYFCMMLLLILNIFPPFDWGFWVGRMLAKRSWVLCMPSGYELVASLRDFSKVFCLLLLPTTTVVGYTLKSLRDFSNNTSLHLAIFCFLFFSFTFIPLWFSAPSLCSLRLNFYYSNENYVNLFYDSNFVKYWISSMGQEFWSFKANTICKMQM